MTYAQVLIDRPARSLDRAFTYAVPDHLRDRVQVGSYVLVPFGKQHLPGFVIGFTSDKGAYQVRDLHGLLLDEALFDESLVEIARWLSDRYLCTPADALRVLLPPGSSRKIRKVVRLTDTGKAPEALETVRRAPKQRDALQALSELGGEAEPEAVLRAIGAQSALPNLQASLTLIETEPSPKRASAVTLSSVEAALGALQDRGLVELRRELERPAVQPLERQIVTLVEREEVWEELLEDLQERAPRQAEVIAALLASSDGTAAVAEFSRPAVQGLAKKGYVTVSLETLDREPEATDWEGASVDALRLNDAQRAVFERARAAMQNNEHCELLVHGVTGSGKTEVYLHCVDLALQMGKTAIVAVPEIALTPQMVGRFKARFGRQLALLHSALGQGERFDEWHRARRGEARIVIGARSAIFAPIPDLGIIIVDEEHENAYKQEQPPRYHGIEAARQRARVSGAVLMLGSATPALERYYEALQPGGLELLNLPARIDDRPMPTIEVIDLRGETLLGTGQSFSQRMLDALSDRLAANEQVMLFLNRRGFSTFVMCRECGYVLRCPECEISLTFHYQGRSCTCHHCDYAQHVPEQCPNCEGYEIKFEGLGTEKVADQITRAFPEAVVARMDRDTIGHKGAYGRILSAFAAGEANVLVGTQMIAKGHDFPGVTLVGVLNADTGLYRPDFRAAEHTFQVLTQVAGRAGRADKPGEVLVQTYNPNHYAILAACRHDYLGFYRQELAGRERNAYPPFISLARVVFAAEDENRAVLEARKFRVVLQEMGMPALEGRECFLGPAPAPLKKLRGKYRYSILLKGQKEALPDRVREALSRHGDARDVTITVDVDPVDMM
ncbi:MAG: primosomal protein N' [Armatimonadia bacterium]